MQDVKGVPDGGGLTREERLKAFNLKYERQEALLKGGKELRYLRQLDKD